MYVNWLPLPCIDLRQHQAKKIWKPWPLTHTMWTGALLSSTLGPSILRSYISCTRSEFVELYMDTYLAKICPTHGRRSDGIVLISDSQTTFSIHVCRGTVRNYKSTRTKPTDRRIARVKLTVVLVMTHLHLKAEKIFVPALSVEIPRSWMSFRHSYTTNHNVFWECSFQK